jgi:hypothetical protein
MRRTTILTRRCFSSKAGGSSPDSYEKEVFSPDSYEKEVLELKEFILQSEYKDFPGLCPKIDELLGVLTPCEIILLIHTFGFTKELNLSIFEILPPDALKKLAADIHNKWKTSEYVYPTAENQLDTSWDMECDYYSDPEDYYSDPEDYYSDPEDSA